MHDAETIKKNLAYWRNVARNARTPKQAAHAEAQAVDWFVHWTQASKFSSSFRPDAQA